MALKLHNKQVAPPGGYRFHCRETGEWIIRLDPTQALEAVRDHYRANNIPIGLLFNEMVEDEWCRNTEPSVCKQDGYGNAAPSRPPTTYEQLKSATKILLQWFIEGKKRESIDEVKRRARICIGCPFNQTALGCPSCGAEPFKELVNKFVGGEPIENESKLTACRICGCSLQAKIRIPLDILKKHEPEFLNAAYPEWCWLKL